jgi:hypothetical protein
MIGPDIETTNQRGGRQESVCELGILHAGTLRYFLFFSLKMALALALLDNMPIRGADSSFHGCPDQARAEGGGEILQVGMQNLPVSRIEQALMSQTKPDRAAAAFAASNAMRLARSVPSALPPAARARVWDLQ